jgi:hypothetical protein
MPALFQWLMEAVMLDISNVLVYIDDLLVNPKTHEEHLEILDKVFSWVRTHNLKTSLKKNLTAAKMSVT